MLDIYYVNSCVTSLPDDPEGLELAESIHLDTHKSLSRLFDACERSGIELKYFDDSYIEPGQIARLSAIFHDRIDLLPDNQTARDGHKAMTAIFSRALEQIWDW